MTPGAPRHQHDTLDQIREHLEAIRDEHRIDQEWCRCCSQEYPCSTSDNAVAALAKFDALLAEGDTVYRTSGVYGNRRAYAANPRHQNGERGVWLLVGVGCGNAANEKGKP